MGGLYFVGDAIIMKEERRYVKEIDGRIFEGDASGGRDVPQARMSAPVRMHGVQGVYSSMLKSKSQNRDNRVFSGMGL
jgi:hypothetical protein